MINSGARACWAVIAGRRRSGAIVPYGEIDMTIRLLRAEKDVSKEASPSFAEATEDRPSYADVMADKDDRSAGASVCITTGAESFVT